MKKHIVVVGGGITGVTSAYSLARQGFQVTLIEKNRYAAMETSYANGGQLSASNAEVWTHRSRPDDRCISHEMRRKVRAPSDTAPGNAWGARAHGKCNRKIPPMRKLPSREGSQARVKWCGKSAPRGW